MIKTKKTHAEAEGKGKKTSVKLPHILSKSIIRLRGKCDSNKNRNPSAETLLFSVKSEWINY